MSKLKGSCLCGAITYGCDADPVWTGLCHCLNCQKQSGAAFSINVAVPKASLKISGSALQVFNDAGDSGLPVQRLFCGNCGSSIASCPAAFPDLALIKAGTLEDTSWLDPTVEIWCETAQPWVEIDQSRRLVQRNPSPRPSSVAGARHR
jgi:hypothetical protein